MVPGAFARVYFPTREKPRAPGLLHIGYVLGGTAVEAMIAYTTSQPWPASTPLPAGARLFDVEEARRLNQSRVFMLRLDVLAKLPMTEAWFPDIAQPGQGVIAVAPARWREELTDLAINLVRRRRSLVQMRGL
ncbi:MAG: hypothetical protein EXR07_12695 [Acetobacteraceae bacterium]|nr:hypothetical protein [Acetobacteraceae bacterium]